MTMLKNILYDRMWHPVNGPEYEHVYSYEEIEEDEGAIVVIPARYHHKDVERINSDLKRLPWVILMMVGDEESTFPVESISHPNMKLWVMTPIPGRHKADHYLPHGYTPDTRTMLINFKNEYSKKPVKWFFSGQITHHRRQECRNVLKNLQDGIFESTPGFGMGLPHEEYYRRMASAKVVPCPAGPTTPDSFRVAEALEAGAVPVADECTQKKDYPEGYWTNLFKKTPPFWIIRNWESFPGYVEDIMNSWPDCANNVFAWWQRYKRNLVYDVIDDLDVLGIKASGSELSDLITVLIPTSPISQHPTTEIIDETLRSIRLWLPKSEIFLMFDGVREDQQHYKSRYNDYIREMLWNCNYEWKNIVPVIFPEHMHQAAMTRFSLQGVRTPLVLFVEHDTPIIGDHSIDWIGITQTILEGHVDLVRFHYDTHIYPSHKPLMLGKMDTCGVPLTKTIQWSQRPHVASTSFYRRILKDNFSASAKTMIEDRMHSVVQQHYKENPITGWNDYRLAIYAPEGYMQRSYHLDGRKADSKFENSFVY